MRSADFVSPTFGILATRPLSDWPHQYLLPNAVPRELPMSGHTVAAISRADLALGRLAGLGLLVQDPELLLGPSMAQEALPCR